MSAQNDTKPNKFADTRNYYAYKDMTLWQRFTGHLKTVCKHKHYVRVACFKMGLYKQGILHDLSKFSPTEFIPSVKYYSKSFSPNITDRVLNGASTSWLHHKGRNKHHFEYWTDYTPRRDPAIFGCKMPMRYVAEMVADRYAACVAYNGPAYHQGSAWEYYEKGMDMIIIHEDTKAVLETALKTMRDKGEDAAFQYIRDLLAKTKGTDY